ncbi:hypothetical protein ACFFLM_15270 [Deinococcus oregonensis]|uniref:Uncharacterized protein n=1 Tax=Deinococcus oregonensis TaxID=1805970 RepID=A0ABV6B0R1_9DEIO
MFQNLFKKKKRQAVEVKKEPPAPQQITQEVAEPVLQLHDLGLPKFDPKPRLDADGTPLVWVKRPGLKSSGLGHFAQQLIDDGIAVDFTPYAWAVLQSGFVPPELTPQYKRILVTANYYLWGSEHFGNALEFVGVMACMGAALFGQTQVEELGDTSVPEGDEGLLISFNWDDGWTSVLRQLKGTGSSAFGQLDGTDTVILMLPEDAQQFQLVDALGRTLPKRSVPNASGRSVNPRNS